jgi:ribonuclease P protein component
MLSRDARINKSRDIRAIFQTRRAYSANLLVLHLRKSVEDERALAVRFGFVVSKKVARKSHDRNRLKRRLREICRTVIIPAVNQGTFADVLLVARNDAAAADFKTLLNEVNQVCRKAGLL